LRALADDTSDHLRAGRDVPEGLDDLDGQLTLLDAQ
jgi:hypothetical protein